ncbi:MAG: MFS transporter [FCB group bacterium]|nr:MFS transporter [FCB group bacterium]
MLLVTAGLLINIVSAGFILILNIYLRKEGYSDARIAAFTSYRFLGVLVLAFPLGLFIKGKKLKPYFVLSSILMPIAGFLMMTSVRQGNILLIKSSFLLWGLGLMLLQVCTLPFIMRNTPEAIIPEAISLSFSTWSFSLIFTGIFIAILSAVGSFTLGGVHFPWEEYEILMLLIVISAFAIFFVLPLKEGPPRSAGGIGSHFKALLLDYDWDKILKALIPTMLIAVGAGLMIPFVSLFFYSVFGIDSDQFSLIGSAAAGLGLIASLLIPAIKRRYGYNIAILLTQSLAVGFLVLMALTQLFAAVTGVVFLAIAFYIIRQPLMHMAAPITSELTMNYVGEKNQELISAINSSIWSASWYISAKIFQLMRSLDIAYYRIFLITAGFYAVGILMYYFIIREYQTVLIKRLSVK